MKVLVDMNLPPTWVTLLVQSGFEAVHWSQVGPKNAWDAELMKWVAERDYIILTADLDFGAILAATHRNRPSIVQLRSDILTPRAIGKSVIAALRQLQQGLTDGVLVSIDAGRARIRVLPFKD